MPENVISVATWKSCGLANSKLKSLLGFWNQLWATTYITDDFEEWEVVIIFTFEVIIHAVLREYWNILILLR